MAQAKYIMALAITLFLTSCVPLGDLDVTSTSESQVSPFASLPFSREVREALASGALLKYQVYAFGDVLRDGEDAVAASKEWEGLLLLDDIWEKSSVVPVQFRDPSGQYLVDGSGEALTEWFYELPDSSGFAKVITSAGGSPTGALVLANNGTLMLVVDVDQDRHVDLLLSVTPGGMTHVAFLDAGNFEAWLGGLNPLCDPVEGESEGSRRDTAEIDRRATLDGCGPFGGGREDRADAGGSLDAECERILAGPPPDRGPGGLVSQDEDIEDIPVSDDSAAAEALFWASVGFLIGGPLALAAEAVILILLSPAKAVHREPPPRQPPSNGRTQPSEPPSAEEVMYELCERKRDFKWPGNLADWDDRYVGFTCEDPAGQPTEAQVELDWFCRHDPDSPPDPEDLGGLLGGSRDGDCGPLAQPDAEGQCVRLGSLYDPDGRTIGTVVEVLGLVVRLSFCPQETCIGPMSGN